MSTTGDQRTAGWAQRDVASPATPREFAFRRASKNGRTIAVLRGLDYGDSCVVDADVFPRGVAPGAPVRPGPYTFATAEEANDFVAETMRALMYLGCEVRGH